MAPKTVIASILCDSQRNLACATVLVCPLTMFAVATAHAQTFQVIHTFTGGPDGGFPYDLTTDAAGNLYGPAECCDLDYGAVYEVERLGSFWLTKPLYGFKGGDDGNLPGVGVAFGPDGLLYGTTYQGGTYNNGTVFSLGPGPGTCGAAFCLRMETVLYSFGYSPGVAAPTGEVTVDQAGNIYGTAQNGPHGAGGVYELTR